MKTRRYRPEDPQTARHARCYNRVNGRFVPVGYTPLNFINGDGNVHSTIVDLAKWERFLHSLDYHLPARELLWSPVLIKGRKTVNYGAGWRLLREKHQELVEIGGKSVMRKHETRAEYHRGEWLGWRSFIAPARNGLSHCAQAHQREASRESGNHRAQQCGLW